MALADEIELAAKQIVTDGYEMSIGELVSLYRDDEIYINPEFQRFFRWELWQKTRFIESLLLGIPIPPIFVFQLPNGRWELIDGLQRLSTIFQFMGVLKQPPEELPSEPLRLMSTKLLPSLYNKCWQSINDESEDSFSHLERLLIKRSRIRVEILKTGSDPKAKFELFNRLNSAGSSLSEQEIRNCMLIMVNKEFFDWLKTLSDNSDFSSTIKFTDDEMDRRKDLEWVLRFVVYRNIPYHLGLDVHEYLDEGGLQLAASSLFDTKAEADIFRRTFRTISNAAGESAFRRFDGTTFTGKVLISAFEMVAVGVSQHIDAWESQPKTLLEERIKSLWSDHTFKKNSGAGVRGTTRLNNLLSYSKEFFKL